MVGLQRKIPLNWMMTGGIPYSRKPPFVYVCWFYLTSKDVVAQYVNTSSIFHPHTPVAVAQENGY